MCYNSKCKIEIKSYIDGTATNTSVKGTVTKMPAEIRFEYVLDGDDCTFTVKDNEAVQIRRGAQNIKMIFRKGEQTDCYLESGGFVGGFTVFTSGLEFADCSVISGKKTVNIYTVSIVYMLGEEKIKLTFSAEYNFNAKV